MTRRTFLWSLAATVAVAAALITWVGDGGGTFRLSDIPNGETGAAPSGRGFPKSFTDYHGFELTLGKPPARIASQALATDSLLFAAVPPERIVAVSMYATEPQYSNIVEIVRRYNIPSIRDAEYAIRLDPDLLLISNISRADFTDLVRQGGIPTYSMSTVFSSLDEISAGLRTIGELTGEPEAAATAIAELEAAIEAAVSKRPAATQHSPPRVLALSGFSYSSGKGSLFEDIVEVLGAINVGSEQGLGAWGKVGSEQIAGWNPDWIVSGTGGAERSDVLRKLLADPAIATTTAGRKAQVLVVEDHYYLTMSQHVVHLVNAIAEALYGAK